MRIATNVKHKPPSLWNIWTVVAVIMIIGAVADDNLFSFLFRDEESHSLFPVKPGIVYYNLLRFTVCGLAIYGLYLNRMTSERLSQFGTTIAMLKLQSKDYNTYTVREKLIYSWEFKFTIIAILFNPIIPLQISRESWLPIDLIVIALLISSLFLFRLPKTIKRCDHCGTIMNRGYYRNYEKNVNGDFIGEELCIWCVNDMSRLGTIEIDLQKPILKDNENNKDL